MRRRRRESRQRRGLASCLLLGFRSWWAHTRCSHTSRDLVRACDTGRAATLRRGPGSCRCRCQWPSFRRPAGTRRRGRRRHVVGVCLRAGPLRTWPTSGYVSEQARVYPRPAEVRPERALLRSERARYLHDAIRALPDRLDEVVERNFFGDESLTDIARDLGVTL